MMTKGFKVLMACLLSVGGLSLPELTIHAAEDEPIKNIKASGKSTANHDADLAIDGDKTTFYLTPPEKSMKDHYRNVDLALDGTYKITKIKIFNNEGSYNNYQIYATDTGSAYQKIAYKNDTKLATAEGDEYTFTDVTASKLRINLSYNSNQMEGNLAEIEVYGTKISDEQGKEEKIEVQDFKDTKWAAEYEKVENDKAYANQKTINEMYAMVGRVIGDQYKDSFTFEMRKANAKGEDIFEIENGADGKIIVRGNSGVALASGFNHYLRYYCKIDYNPLFASNLDMPSVLPKVEGKIVKETEYDIRYALNFCTYSYTMAFWDWDEYEAFMDWAAMSGINTMLDIVGQEEVIRRTLSKFGYTDEEIKEYIVGPGYFAWFYMQNMTSFGGKLPNNWFDTRVELGRKMHDRMQTLGITPVLSGYSGQIPRNFKEKYPDVEYVDQGGWAGSGYERPDMIRTYLENENGRDYFSEMADAFYTAQKEIFGDVTNMYSVDPFHEGGNMGEMDPTKVYETIQNKMLEHDKNAVWVIQEWSGSIANHTDKLANLDKAHVLVLDLFSEVSPRNSAMEKAETPWVWNMLHNFGGRMGLDGNPEKISQEIPKTFQNSKYMKGIGMTPEAIENSPMVYELLFDMTWTKDPIDFREWTQKYVERNYGGTNDEIKEAWDILLNTGYNKKDGYYQGAPESVFNSRPKIDFTSASSWGHSTINYDMDELERAAALLANNYDEFKDKESFIYDLSDVLRQVLSNSGLEYYKAMMSAYNSKNLDEFKAVSKKFLEMIQLQDQVLSTNKDFLVGPWIEESRTMMKDADDWTKDLFEYNARTLITTWGSQSESDTGLRDYSNRQWAGLTKDYYYPRWELFINDCIKAMEEGKPLPNNNSHNWFLKETSWSTKKTDEGSVYATTPSNENLKELAEIVLSKYTNGSVEDLVDNIETKENIAFGKTVTSSVASNTDHPTKNLTDGNKGSAWFASKHEQTFTLTLDLGSVSSIDGIEIAMKQIPEQFPYKYNVEVLRDGKWSEVARDDNGSIIESNVKINYKGIGSQVRFNFETTDGRSVPEIYELQVYGVADSNSDYTNVALNKPATAQGSTTTNLTDGNPSTKWAGNDVYPSEIVVDLKGEEYVEYMNLHFEKAGVRFQYTVEVEDESGNKTMVSDMSKNTEDLDQMYKISINKKITKIYVTLTGKAPNGPFPGVWPCVAEIEAFQKKGQNLQAQNIAEGKPGNVQNSSNPYTTTKLTNGNIKDLENVGSDIFPTTFQVDLGSDEMIDEVMVYFEKAGIRFKFLVEVEDSEGKKTTILDMTDNKDDLAAMYKIPANVKGSKINVVIKDRAPGGQFYLASPALAEIEAYAKPKSVSSDAKVTSNVALTDEEMNALIDGDHATTVDLSGKKDGEAKEFVFEFPKAVDIYTYELMKGSGEALQYKIEYIAENEKAETWKLLDDKTANIKDTEKYIGEFKPVLTKKMKLTVMNDKVKLSGLNVYQYNMVLDLSSYITSLKKTISDVSIGEYPGDYTASAKAILDEAIKVAEDKSKEVLNSNEVAQAIKELKTAYSTFLKSYVTIDRSDLLSELTTVDALLQMDELKHHKELQTAYQEAYAVYDTVKVTQLILNDATDALRNVKDRAMELLDEKTKLKAEILIAKALADQAGVGDFPGNVTQENKDAFLVAIQKAEADILLAQNDEEVKAVREQLQTAIEAFKNSYIVVNKDALADKIADAKALEESEYSKDSWKAIQEALKEAELIYTNENSSISMVDKAKADLQTALENKVLLHRSTLKATLLSTEELKQSEYTKDSWKALMDVVKEAKEVFQNVSVNQNELDEANTSLTKAIKSLVKLDRSKVDEMIARISRMLGSDYVEKDWNELVELVKEVRIKLESGSWNQEDIDALFNDLEEKVHSLEIADNKESLKELNSAIENAKKYLTPNKYTADSYHAFKQAYDEAVSLVKDDKALNSAIKQAIMNLVAKSDQLKEVSSQPKPDVPSTDNGQGNQNNSNGNSNGNQNEAPGTGDHTNVTNWMLLLLLSTGGLMFGLKKRKFAEK